MTNKRNCIWDTKSASDWANAYPLGDGRTGAMVFGNPCNEIISLNHDLLWRGYLKQPTFGTHKDMPRIKELCRQKKYAEAEELLKKTLPNQNTIYINPFIPAFDQYITMYLPEENVTDYKRWLDLENGIAHTEFTVNGVTYHRESFCSAEYGALITHMTASLPCSLTGEVSISRLCDLECEVDGGADFDSVYASGTFEEGVKFAAVSKIFHRNGRTTGGKKNYGIENDTVPQKKFGLGYVFTRDEMFNSKRGASVCFDTCDELWIVTVLSTDAESNDPLTACRRSLENEFDFESLYNAQCKRFSEYYNRIKLELSEEKEFDMPTAKFLERDREKGLISPVLCELTYNMSRYTAIASGMPRLNEEFKAPINLQGLWNRDTRPAWESDYHLDLNIQMCYWPLPSMGLTDLMEPFLCWIENLLPQAKKCAKDIYGCNGAAYMGCCDFKTIGATDVVGAGALGISAWLTQILWIYYEHLPSENLLKRIFNLMEEIEIFYSEMFTEEKGEFTFPFGSSPEMSLDIDGHIQWFSSASTFDLTVVREFYTNLHTAAIILKNKGTEEKTADILKKLKKPHITEDGTLCEWSEEHKENEVGHRHRSPFVSFCPGSLYTKETDPETVSAMEKLLEKRLGAGNGMSTAFSYSWDAQILARMDRGEEAYEKLETLLKIHGLDNLLMTTNDWDGKNGGITWFTGTKLMQVEAQLGFCSALTDMIFRDNKGIVQILPALPQHLPTGKLLGIKGRNGIQYDIRWENGKLSELCIYTKESRDIVLTVSNHNEPLKIFQNGEPISYTEENGTVCFKCEANSVYTVK
ncbi:MAG: glycoside hydrolase family 95 protein [Ruminococcaceae bacterium]|nr:glycoside hydrolase family 95 protein [Oscillospiraceae bacterium]